MKIQLLCVSKRPSAWVASACDEYLKRLGGHLKLEIREIAPVTNQPTRAAVLAKEAEKIKRACPSGAQLIALDERGKAWSTATLAKNLSAWQTQALDICLVIGGAAGLEPSLVDNASARWSLSNLTLPHQMARVIVVEQIYRALSINLNHPYHRAD